MTMTQTHASPSLETIMKLFTATKISIPIQTNELCETTVLHENLGVDVHFAKLKIEDGVLGTGSHEKNDTRSLNRNATMPTSNKSESMERWGYLFACLSDPMMSLFTGNTLRAKLTSFMKNKTEDLDNYKNVYKLFKKDPYTKKYSVEEIKQVLSGKTNDDALLSLFVLKYISLDMNVNVVYGDLIIQKDATDGYLYVDKTSSGPISYKMYNSGFSDLMKQNMDEKLKSYGVINDIKSTPAPTEAPAAAETAPKTSLKTLKVAELRDLAKTLGVVTTVVVEGKRRNLLKAELVTALETHTASDKH